MWCFWSLLHFFNFHIPAVILHLIRTCIFSPEQNIVVLPVNNTNFSMLETLQMSFIYRINSLRPRVTQYLPPVSTGFSLSRCYVCRGLYYTAASHSSVATIKAFWRGSYGSMTDESFDTNPFLTCSSYRTGQWKLKAWTLTSPGAVHIYIYQLTDTFIQGNYGRGKKKHLGLWFCLELHSLSKCVCHCSQVNLGVKKMNLPVETDVASLPTSCVTVRTTAVTAATRLPVKAAAPSPAGRRTPVSPKTSCVTDRVTAETGGTSPRSCVCHVRRTLPHAQHPNFSVETESASPNPGGVITPQTALMGATRMTVVSNSRPEYVFKSTKLHICTHGWKAFVMERKHR